MLSFKDHLRYLAKDGLIKNEIAVAALVAV